MGRVKFYFAVAGFLLVAAIIYFSLPMMLGVKEDSGTKISPDPEQAVAAARQEKMPVMVEFYADT